MAHRTEWYDEDDGSGDEGQKIFTGPSHSIYFPKEKHVDR